VLVAVSNLIGLALLVIGLTGARTTTEPHRLLLFLNVAAVGLVVALGGNGAFLLEGLRQVGRLRGALLVRPVREQVAAAPPQTPTDPIPAGVLVAAEGMTRFHDSRCAAAAGKPVVPAPVDEHRAAGRVPCGLCLPTHADTSPETHQ
jgi:hypothetical protein